MELKQKEIIIRPGSFCNTEIFLIMVLELRFILPALHLSIFKYSLRLVEVVHSCI